MDNNETGEFLAYKKLIEDFNKHGVGGVAPEYKIDAEYIYDIKNSTKETFDITTNRNIEVLMTTEERKNEIAEYAQNCFNIVLNRRLTIPKMLDQLFSGVIELNDFHVNDFREENEERVSGYTSGDLVYAISLLNDEDVAEGLPPNNVAMKTAEDVLKRIRNSKKEIKLIKELDDVTINRILDKNFIIGV